MYLSMYSQNGRNNIKLVDFFKKGFACFQIQFMQKSRHRSKQQPDNSFSEMSFWILRIIEFSENQVPTTHGIYK